MKNYYVECHRNGRRAIPEMHSVIIPEGWLAKYIRRACRLGWIAIASSDES